MNNIESIDERIYWEKLSDETRNERIKSLEDKHFTEYYNNIDSKICEDSGCFREAKYKVKTSKNEIFYSCEKHKDDIGEKCFSYFSNDFENYMHKETREIESYDELRRSNALIRDYIKLTEEETIAYVFLMLIRQEIRKNKNCEELPSKIKRIAKKYDEIFAISREIYFDENILKIVRESIKGQKDLDTIAKAEESIIDYLLKL